jgi:hypothetical protein
MLLCSLNPPIIVPYDIEDVIIMIDCKLPAGELKEGVARLDFAETCALLDHRERAGSKHLPRSVTKKDIPIPHSCQVTQ